MVKCTLLLAIASLLAFAIEAQENCINDYTFRQFGTQKRSCSWIRFDETRRQKNCLDIDVMKNCPQTCGECCENDVNYKLTTDTGHIKTCEWVGNKLKRKKKYCNTFNSKMNVKNACPLACGICKAPLNRPPQPGVCANNEYFRHKGKSLKSCEWIGRLPQRRNNACAAQEVRTNCPRSCRTCCEDDKTFIFTTDNNREKTCGWIADDPTRQKKYCDTLSNGVLIANKCLESCGLCSPLTPTLSPQPSTSPVLPPPVDECRVNATLSFPSIEEAVNGYHNDELSVSKQGSDEECSIKNQKRSWCSHDGIDGLIHKDPYYEDRTLSQSESVQFLAKPEESYLFKIEHHFTTSEPFHEAYYDKDHMMAGVLEISANEKALAEKFSRDVYDDVDSLLGTYISETNKYYYNPNPKYDAEVNIALTCDAQCRCVANRLED
mmetsp:Transcript_29633/g.45289  ORF Transcript_29633/g.45289 Transcript_29633/m.45289 type:complete len:435 (-) Transcript_29633:89-1393(-)